MPIELILTGPTASEVLVDGPIRLSLWLKNTGQGSMDAPAPEEFEYRVYDVGDVKGQGESKLLCTASILSKEESIPQLSSAPVSTPSSVSLGGGAMYAYPTDLTALLTELLPPGKYQVEAVLSGDTLQATSEQVPFEVMMSWPAAFAQALDGRRQRLVLIEFHQEPREEGVGPVRLRLRRSESTLLDRFHDLHTFEPATPLQQTALTIDSAYGVPGDWRWIAWMDGNDLYCGAARKADFLYPKGPVDLQLGADARLLPYGYVTANGNGTFLVTGLDRGDGKRKIRMVTIPPGKDTQPVLTDLHLATVPADAIPESTMVCAGDGKRELVLYWRVQAAGIQIVAAGRFDPETGAMLAKPGPVFQTSRQVLASQAPPVVFLDGQAEDAFQVLLAPDTAEGRFTLVAIRVGDGEKLEFDLPALDDSLRNSIVARWVLPSNHVPGKRAAIVTSNGEVWLTSDGGGPSWRRIGGGDGLDAGSVRLWAFDARLAACTWFDKTKGYVSVKV